MKLGNLIVAALAVAALLAGSTLVHGVTYWVFTAGVVLAAAGFSGALYVRRSRRWILKAYQLLGDGELRVLEPLVDAELKAVSPVARPVLELLRGELRFWAGDFEQAYVLAKKLELESLPEVWRSALHGLLVAAAAFTGRHDEARATLEANREGLSERPGFHYLEALVALRAGDVQRARERFLSVTEAPPKLKMVRAARAMLRAELGRAAGEPIDAWVEEAVRDGGDSFVAARARELQSSSALTS
ncbi:MAG: hypothetical protein IPJ65_16965 [Archangiaceae bacterium]|nr:hypothetical protein [Archangiaceae bacterium]